jgi:hypothetical protein
MDPVFTLQWPEFIVAERLQKELPKKDGYSILLPLSRQEKGIDLAILRKRGGDHRTITIQVKASRTYAGTPNDDPANPEFLHYTWFRRFDVPDEADFILLVGMYAPDSGQTKRVSEKWYRDCTLLFTREEMREFIASCLTAKGTPDQMFSFGFNSPKKVVLARPTKSFRDYTKYLLDSRIGEIRDALA